MNKYELRVIEHIARKLMTLEINIWKKYDWESEADVRKHKTKLKTYQKEVKKMIKDLRLKKLSDEFYFIFQDANFHLFNETLIKLGWFESKKPFLNKAAYEKFLEYRNEGGKTWELLEE